MQKRVLGVLSWLVIAAATLPQVANAVPSFARQTGLSCAMCHTVFPQLTPYGREFKLSGYTLTDDMSKATDQLSLGTQAPLALMLQFSYASIAKTPPNTPSDGTAFPNELSLFYAGRIAHQAGAFVQVTLDNTNSIGVDNADVRLANQTQTADGKPLIYGVSFNNAPTVEDILNTTPVWAAFPSSTAEAEGAPMPQAGTLLGGDVLNQQTLGVLGYGMYDKHWYGAAGLYHNTNTDTTAEGLVGWAPYLRLVYQQDDGTRNWAVGLIGLSGKVQQVGTSGGPADKYTDTGVDAQYQLLQDHDTLTIRAAYLTEKRNNDFSVSGAAVTPASNASDKLNNFNVSATYFRDRRHGGSIGYFSITGDADTALWGGKPDSNYWMAEYDYLPWLNTKFSLQYTAYGKFDGSTSGAGDNNTLYALAWIMF